MSERYNLPTTTLQDAAWEGDPLRPLDEPELFDSVLWRREVGYGIDVLLLMVIFSILGLIAFLSFGLRKSGTTHRRATRRWSECRW
jgi:hypothetical protein